MEEYIKLNTDWVSLYNKQIITDQILYFTLDATHRIKIEQFGLTQQIDSWSGFADTAVVGFDEITTVEKNWVLWELRTLLSSFSNLTDRQTETNIHMSLVPSFLNNNNIIDYKLLGITWSSCCNIYYKFA